MTGKIEGHHVTTPFQPEADQVSKQADMVEVAVYQQQRGFSLRSLPDMYSQLLAVGLYLPQGMADAGKFSGDIEPIEFEVSLFVTAEYPGLQTQGGQGSGNRRHRRNARGVRQL